MKHKTLKVSYETPSVDVQLFEAEGVLCMSSGTATNEGYNELDNEYNFEWKK